MQNRLNPKDFEEICPDFRSFREGDYRVLYELIHDDNVVLIHSIGHRSEIYKD